MKVRRRSDLPVSARRDEIVEIAKGHFAEKGYAATSIRDIGEACGLLAGSLYSHFRSKAEILSLAISPFYDRLLLEQQAVMATEARGIDRLRQMVERVLALCAQHPTEVRILHYDWPHIQASEDLDDLFDMSMHTLDLWREVIEGGVADGSLRPDVDSETAMRMVTSTLHGVLDRQRYGTREDLAAGRGIDWLTRQVIDVLLAGMASAPARPAAPAGHDGPAQNS